VAFNVFGDRNTVAAGPGPLALAGSIFQRDATIRQPNTGFNINGLAVPGVASGASGAAVASVPRRTVSTAAAKASAVAPAAAAATAQRPAAKAVSSRTVRKNTR
jgi:hypothetical protein